jgi:putative mycofactocin binding protein MftB
VTTPGFDPDNGYQQCADVGLRPEPFGALAYHFVTRRLVFLKSPTLVELVGALSDHPSATAAVDAVVAPDSDHERQRYLAALASLCESGVVESRSSDADDSPTSDTPKRDTNPGESPDTEVAA